MTKLGDYQFKEKKQVVSVREEPKVKSKIVKKFGGTQAFWDAAVIKLMPELKWKKKKKL